MKAAQIHILKKIKRPLADLSVDEIKEILKKNNNQSEIDCAELKADLLKKIEEFKNKSYKRIPELTSLKIDTQIWQNLLLQFIIDNKRNLSSSYLIYLLEKNSVPSATLKKAALPRKSKDAAINNINSQTKKLFDAKPAPRYRTHEKKTDRPVISSDPLAKTAEEKNISHVHKPLKEIPETLSSPYHKKYQSPEGKTYYQAAIINGRRLFLEITPEKECSILKKSPGHQNQDKNQFVVREQQFTVSLKLMNERKGVQRYPSQYQLFGQSARESFIENGDENAENQHGRLFHLSHAHAFYQGGAQSRDNIFPSTASANYKILQQIEKPIEKILKNRQAEKIDVIVKKFYSSQASKIPKHVSYKLNWIDKAGKTHEEEHNMNPRSFRKVNRNLLKTTEQLRDLSSQTDIPSDSPAKKTPK